MGLSVKKTLMGKTFYNDAGQNIGQIDDLIVTPDLNGSYVIVGAGGFIGLDRHDVAVAVSQIQHKAGRLVMAGATEDSIKAMPEFTYATDSARRDQFVAGAEADIARGRGRLSELQKKAGTTATDAKATVDLQITARHTDLRSAKAKLSELKEATTLSWTEFQAGVSEATARVRKSIGATLG